MEFNKIKEHPLFTYKSLEKINGFELIAKWAANHHERLDGSGYPFGKNSKELDFNSRLIACLDIYQALVEDRPYRPALSHQSAINIMRDMADKGKIDNDIVNDIDKEIN